MKQRVVVGAIFLCCMIMGQCAGTVSFVYNLRIAEITKRQAFDQQGTQGNFLEATILIDQIRKKYDGSHQNAFGGLESFIYLSENMYCRFDWAVGHVRDSLGDYHFSRTQTDDILCMGGYSHSISKRTRFTLSGLLGIPTHKETSFVGIQFGTGHVGTGLQLDNAFIYSDDNNHSLRSAVRFVRFFPRMTTIPALMGQKFKFNLGNLIDLYLAHHSKFGHHRFEFGYNPSFLFGASIKPVIPEIINETTYIRSNFYVSYLYYYLVANHPAGFITAISYGFDHISKVFGLKRLITLWGGWGINF